MGYKNQINSSCSIGLKSGYAPANFAFVAVLTSSFALLAFSKY